MDEIKIPNIPVSCVANGLILNITSHNGYTYTVANTGFTVKIENLINPNKVPALSDGISVYILTTATFAKWYRETIATPTFTDPPKNLELVTWSSSNANTRGVADYTIRLKPS